MLESSHARRPTRVPVLVRRGASAQIRKARIAPHADETLIDPEDLDAVYERRKSTGAETAAPMLTDMTSAAE